jgi:ketosteroid isomerase-like protein
MPDTHESAVDTDTLQRLNQNYIRSVQESDVGYFEEALAEDFMSTRPDCSLVGRAEFLAQIARPVGISNLEAHDVRIRLLGNMAIIHARTTYTKPDGRPGAGRYTDIWAKKEGRWLCVAAHVTRQ